MNNWKDWSSTNTYWI